MGFSTGDVDHTFITSVIHLKEYCVWYYNHVINTKWMIQLHFPDIGKFAVEDNQPDNLLNPPITIL